MELTNVVIVEGHKVFISMIILSVTLMMTDNIEHRKRTFEKMPRKCSLNKSLDLLC